MRRAVALFDGPQRASFLAHNVSARHNLPLEERKDNPMELRNGVYTSQSRADDARDIVRFAKKIREKTVDTEIEGWAKRIIRIADDLERELG